MRKKFALVLTSLLILTALLTTPYFTPPATAPEAPSPSPEGVYHWKIMLAQKNVPWAMIQGWLTFQGEPIPGTNFTLVCTEFPYGYVFTKINTTVIPTDIHYQKWIEGPPIYEIIDHPFPNGEWPEEPHTWYQHIESDVPEPPYGWAVVVEVREQPYEPDRPYFEWQLMMKTHNVTASWSGFLTEDGVKMPGTDFALETITDPDLQCQVVQTPYCHVPNDIHYTLIVNGDPIIDDIDEQITQFPWTRTETVGPGQNVTLELTEVQMYRYVVMVGEMDSSGQLGNMAEWHIGDWQYLGGTPFATRPPYLSPLHAKGSIPDTVNEKTYGLNITFTQRDPITGIVELGVPAASYVGLSHIWWGNDTALWFNLTISLETQGCGWLFTGVGKDPILGDVDVITYNDQVGVHSNATGQLLAGSLPPQHPASPAAGAGPPIGPCLQELRGYDGIPGTDDDPIGDGIPDPPGSSILYLPTKMDVYYWLTVPTPQWVPMFASPWPQLMTTGTASDVVADAVQPGKKLVGDKANRTGAPWEFFAGLDHPEYGLVVPWKHKKSNAYVRYVGAWSVIAVTTALAGLDVIFYVDQKLVREDVLIADINCDELVDIGDIVLCAIAFGAKDEGPGPDGKMGTPDDKPIADPNYNGGADLMPAEGEIDIGDIVRIAIDFGKTLTP